MTALAQVLSRDMHERSTRRVGINQASDFAKSDTISAILSSPRPSNVARLVSAETVHALCGNRHYGSMVLNG